MYGPADVLLGPAALCYNETTLIPMTSGLWQCKLEERQYRCDWDPAALCSNETALISVDLPVLSGNANEKEQQMVLRPAALYSNETASIPFNQCSLHHLVVAPHTGHTGYSGLVTARQQQSPLLRNGLQTME